MVTLEAYGDFILCVLVMPNLMSLWPWISKKQGTSLSLIPTATERKLLHCSLHMLLHCTVSILDFNPNAWREILGDGCSLAAGSSSHAEQCVLPLTWYERRDVQCGCIFPPGLLLLWLNIQSGLCVLPLSRLLFEVTVLNELVWKVIWFQVGKGVTQISLEPQLGISNHIWC